MSIVAVLIETAENNVKKSNFGVLSAARNAGGSEIYGFVIGVDAQGCRDDLARYGVNKIISINAEDTDLSSRPDMLAKAVIAALKEYNAKTLMSLGSSTGNDILARIAVQLGVPLALDCLSVDLQSKTVRKPYFAGKTIATLRLNGEYFICGIRANAVEAVEAQTETEILSFSTAVDADDAIVIKEVTKTVSGKVDLAEADVIVSGGRPIGSADNFGMLEKCAATMNGAVGASRVPVDEGYAPHTMQVGQTGKIVNPRLYIACGIAGSIQHYAGMKTSKVIVAINSDKDSPIFNKCDYGIIGDIFEVVPALTAELSK
jgi:electron transfer flavoprotein alpha subunit